MWKLSDAREYMAALKDGLPDMMICVACNGGVQGKESNPNIPESADEIADSVHEAYVAGATMVHVHARDPDRLYAGARTTEVWQEVNNKIRQRCPDIIINNTTGGDFEMSMEERLSCLGAGPEVASLNLTPDMTRMKLKERPAPLPHPRPAIEFDDCIPFSYRTVRQFAEQMKNASIKPELEVYHSGAHWVIDDLIDAGLVEPPYIVQTVMGYQTSSWPTPQALLDLLRDLPRDAIWFCSGIGPFQLPMTTMAILLGGHVRVGLEDNIYLARGRKFESNAEAVARVVRLAAELNRKIATPEKARAMLNLSGVPHDAGGRERPAVKEASVS